MEIDVPTICRIPAGTNVDLAAIRIERVDGTKERHPIPLANDIPVYAGDKIGIEMKPLPSNFGTFTATIPLKI